MAAGGSTVTGARQERVERQIILAALIVFATVYAIAVARTAFRHDGHLVGTLFDDALISLRYAQNLVAGHGLVWNPGEQPPVEGYTNLGWTLVMAAVALVVPPDMAPIGVSAAAALILLASGLAAWSLLRTVGAGVEVRVAGLMLVLACYPTVFWSLRGMEVGLLSLLLLLTLRFALADPERRPVSTLLLISGLGGLGVLTRNDSALLFVPVLAWAAWRRGGFRHAVPAVLPLAMAVAAQLAFRYAYYGAFVPNTYVLKMTGVALDMRIAAGFVALADTLPPVAGEFTLIALAARAPGAPASLRHLTGLTLLVLLAQWAYLVYIGGDAWVIDYSNRFTATVMPALLAAAVAAIPTCLRRLAQSRPAAGAFVAGNALMLAGVGLRHPHTIGPGSHWTILAGWVVLLAVALTPVVARRTRAMSWPTLGAAAVASIFLLSPAHGWIGWARWNSAKAADDIAFARLGLMLRRQLPADAVIAADWLGGPAYFSGRKAIDLLGKTDAYIARLPGTGAFRPGHNKKDLQYSIGRLRPDVVHHDDPVVAGYGYQRLPNGLWIRSDSPAGTTNPALASSWCPEASDSVYCPYEAIASR